MSHLATGPLSPAEVPRALGELEPEVDGWSAVRTRSPERPRAGVYLDDYFGSRRRLRAGRDTDGTLCGFGLRNGRAVAYAAQTGTATRPAGFRAATRLVRTADRLGIPVLTLVDTPGAAADPDAERDGVGPALAELFAAVAAASVPVTTLVIGEGGSGGALALCSTDRLWIAPDAYFSVTAPELAASILKRRCRPWPASRGRTSCSNWVSWTASQRGDPAEPNRRRRHRELGPGVSASWSVPFQGGKPPAHGHLSG